MANESPHFDDLIHQVRPLVGDCGVPQVVLAARMGCLKGAVVANVVVPTADYVRFATHYGFRPDFCEAADLESKGIVEALCRYAQVDFVAPAGGWADEDEANVAAIEWCAEVNANLHSEIAAVPVDRLGDERPLLHPLPSLRPLLTRGEIRKVDKFSTVRLGSARYSVPKELVGRSVEVVSANGGIEVHHRGQLSPSTRWWRRASARSSTSTTGDRARGPARGVHPRTGTERAFLALGPAAEAFLRAAAAAGTSKLGTELAQIGALEAAWGREALVAGLDRAVGQGPALAARGVAAHPGRGRDRGA